MAWIFAGGALKTNDGARGRPFALASHASDPIGEIQARDDFAPKAPPLEWDPQWLPEALAAGLETPSKHDEKLPIQAREIAQWTNTPAHKKALIESLLAREKSIFGS